MAKRRQASRPKFSEEMEGDLTPLINCMFLMLIYFMVCTTFANTKGLSVDLPGGQGSESKAAKDMNIVIDKDGGIQVNGQSTPKEALAEKISQVMQADNTKSVILEADRSVAHSQVVYVVDVARGQGIEGVAFAKAAEQQQ